MNDALLGTSITFMNIEVIY